MSLATRVQSAALRAIQRLGTTCTVVEVAGTYDPAEATVAETLTTHAGVLCSDLFDESKRYAQGDTSLRCVGTIYIPASGLGFTPATGNRVTISSRSFQAVAVMPMSAQGTTCAYRLDLAEVVA